MPTRAPLHRPPGWKPAPKNPNKAHSLYHTAAWAKVRARVLKRDGYRCTHAKCETPNRGFKGRLTVHHTRGREGDLALDDQWCVTRCATCHQRYDHPDKGSR